MCSIGGPHIVTGKKHRSIASMLGWHVPLWSVMILLLQVAVATVPRRAEDEEFNIEAMIDDFVKSAAGKNTVLWWDMNAQEAVLKNNPHLRNRKVTVSTGPVVYGNETTISVGAPDVYVHWVHNDRYNKSHTSVVKKVISHTHSYTWSLEKTFALEHTIKLAVGIPQEVAVESSTKASFNLRRGSRDTHNDTTQVQVQETVTVKPRRSLKLVWTVENIVKDIPWTVNVTLRGWVAVWYYYKVQGHHLWFYPIDFIAREGLQHIPGGGVQFTAKGTFRGVNSQGSSLRVEDHDLEQYWRKPLKVTYRPVKEVPVTTMHTQENL